MNKSLFQILFFLFIIYCPAFLLRNDVHSINWNWLLFVFEKVLRHFCQLFSFGKVRLHFCQLFSFEKERLHFCQFARSGTFACYGDMTVTMDKINSKADGPIDGKKGDGRLLMIKNRILFFFLLPDLSNTYYLLEATLCSEFQRYYCHCHSAWSGLKLGFAKHH